MAFGQLVFSAANVRHQALMMILGVMQYALILKVFDQTFFKKFAVRDIIF